MSIKGFEVGGVQQQYDYTALDNIPANLVQDANYVHTDNNYTNADKTKLSGVEAQANKTTIDATLTHSGQAADAKATGDAISALDAQVIASMPNDTASGSIASFPDGAAMPVIDCSVVVAPNQNLNGYDNPWPAGGGKNKFNGAAVTTTHTSNWGVSWDEATQKLTIEHKNTYYTGAPTLDLSLPVGTYTVKCASATGAFQINKDGQYLIQCDATARQFTVEEGSVYTALFYNANASTFVFEKIQIEAGSSATSYALFSNICPISGWTECKVTRTGENIAPSDKWQAGLLTRSGQTSSVLYAQRTLFLPCEPNTSYILKISEEKNICLFGYETDQSNPRATTLGTAVLGKEASITTGANDAFIRACVRDTDTSVTLNFSDFSPVVLAKDAQVYTIDLNGTRYGGTLDVTTGKLTVDRAMQDLGALSYTYTSSSAQFRSTTALDNALLSVDSNDDVHAISSMYKVAKYADLAANDFYLTIVFQGSFAAGQVWLKNSNYTDPNVFKAAMSGVQLCYELATPIEVDLTPTEVTTLLGTNNIFADCGNTTVDYYADTTLFVNKKIAAAVAALS